MIPRTDFGDILLMWPSHFAMIIDAKEEISR